MTTDEIQRVEALAGRLGCTTRDVLLAAALMVDQADVTLANVLGVLRQRPRDSLRSVVEAADLLLTPASAYAPGHVREALTALWQRVPRNPD